jgi:8-hydroxy-5-deazaflavin:NADPH oxidoreductase
VNPLLSRGFTHFSPRNFGLAADLGWTDVFDLGDLSGARGMEMYLPLWLRIYGQLGRGAFNIKVVR